MSSPSEEVMKELRSKRLALKRAGWTDQEVDIATKDHSSAFDVDLTDLPYMNGLGTMSRTIELTEAAWDAVPCAWIGSSAGALLVIFSVTWLLSSFGYVGRADFVMACAGVIIGIAISVFSSSPWLTAIREVKNHTDRLKDENEKRGSGWAKS